MAAGEAILAQMPDIEEMNLFYKQKRSLCSLTWSNAISIKINKYLPFVKQIKSPFPILMIDDGHVRYL